MTVERIMTAHANCVSPDISFQEIQHHFNTHVYHHLPVTDELGLCGIISDRDVMACIAKYAGEVGQHVFSDYISQLTAADVMTKGVITVDRYTPIATASILLLEHNISCLPVVDEDNNVEGILTWKDILRFSVYNT